MECLESLPHMSTACHMKTLQFYIVQQLLTYSDLELSQYLAYMQQVYSCHILNICCKLFPELTRYGTSTMQKYRAKRKIVVLCDHSKLEHLSSGWCTVNKTKLINQLAQQVVTIETEKLIVLPQSSIVKSNHTADLSSLSPYTHVDSDFQWSILLLLHIATRGWCSEHWALMLFSHHCICYLLSWPYTVDCSIANATGVDRSCFLPVFSQHNWLWHSFIFQWHW